MVGWGHKEGPNTNPGLQLHRICPAAIHTTMYKIHNWIILYKKTMISVIFLWRSHCQSEYTFRITPQQWCASPLPRPSWSSAVKGGGPPLLLHLLEQKEVRQHEANKKMEYGSTLNALAASQLLTTAAACTDLLSQWKKPILLVHPTHECDHVQRHR